MAEQEDGHRPGEAVAAASGRLWANTAAGVVAGLLERDKTVSSAESLTGGMVAVALTDVPGASGTVRGGLVAYTDEVKIAALGVPRDLIDAHTAVSAPVALAMAAGARRLFDTDFAVATTGEAGPTSATGKPVGTVFVAAVDRLGRELTRGLALAGDRLAVRGAATVAALGVLAHLVESGTDPGPRRLQG